MPSGGNASPPIPTFSAGTSLLAIGRISIIGVARPEFRLDAKVDVWVPLPIIESPTDQATNTTLSPACARVSAVPRQSPISRTDCFSSRTRIPTFGISMSRTACWISMTPLVGDIRPALEILMGAVALVLVIVSANILSLLLTRSIARRREMSLRSALGASAWRILRQLLVENALLCLAGGIAGILLAQLAAPVLMHLSPLELPAFSSMQVGRPGPGICRCAHPGLCAAFQPGSCIRKPQYAVE